MFVWKLPLSDEKLVWATFEIHQGSHILEDPGAVSGDDGSREHREKPLFDFPWPDYLKSPTTRL